MKQSDKAIIGETYFFRDKGQFALLRNWILPELIEKRGGERTLRIWSAGCSSGEEPYSIATLVYELIPDRSGWDICIVGTDINDQALIKAGMGAYGEWSFRDLKLDERNRYFKKAKNGWMIDERIKEMVIFRPGNLITDLYPDQDLHDMDLILCRNVFIYFDHDDVRGVVKKLADTLREDGYLMTGHAEIGIYKDNLMTPRIFPESLVYQKISHHAASMSQPACTVIPAGFRVREKKALTPGLFLARPPSPKGERYKTTPFPTTGLAPGAAEGGEKGSIEETLDSWLKAARAMADRGRYEESIMYCEKAIKAAPFDAGPCHLLAQIARETGDIEQEKALLKKVLYLSPSNPAAYLELGIIYEDEGDPATARRMRKTALSLLETMPEDSGIAPYELTAGELADHVRKMLE